MHAGGSIGEQSEGEKRKGCMQACELVSDGREGWGVSMGKDFPLGCSLGSVVTTTHTHTMQALILPCKLITNPLFPPGMALMAALSVRVKHSWNYGQVRWSVIIIAGF